MSEWSAPYSCSSAVPGPKRQSLMKGCMGALPQMFQWSRMLGSNNKCIATTSADVQTLPVASDQKQTEIYRWAKQLKPVVLLSGQQHREEAAAVSNESATSKASESSMCRETDQTAGMVLRQVLNAKQEPFVLQDVIREKRQPLRTHSSRELKFGAPSTRRSRKMKNGTTSKGQDEDGEYTAACRTQYCVVPKMPTGSAAVVRRNRVPVESMVAMPSYQAPAVCGVNSAIKAHSKAASQGRNPVKSPNKRALLMEAAARILEGSNHSMSKRPSSSVRSLLEELEKSKYVKELSKPKEKLVRPVLLHSKSSERELVLSPNVVILGDKAAESKQHQNSYDLKLLSKHNSNSSCKHHCEMPHILDKDLLVMQSRVFPYDNALDVAESLATPVQNPGSEIKSEQVQFMHDDLWSGMIGTRKETMNQIVRGFTFDSSEVLLQAKTMVLPEVIITEDQLRELDHDAFLKDSRAIVPSTSIDSGADFLPVVLSTCLRPNFDNGTPSLIRNIVLNYSLARHFYTWSYHAAAPFPVNNPEKSDSSSARSTGTSLIEGANETGYTYRARDMKVMEAERQSNVMQLRLCNYSWWANFRQNNSPEKGENQLSTEYCAGYDSPVAARCPCFEKVWNEERKDREEEAPSCVCVDEFQQASPVSVLEPVIYEEELELELELDHSLDNFEGAMQKLLEKVRRYEMLAHMDVDMLKKVSEENLSHAWDDDDNESWETDYSSSFQASPAHDSSSTDVVEEQKRFKEPYINLFPEESRLYGQEVEMLPPTSSMDCLTLKLEPRPISCRVLRLAQDEGEAPVQSQRVVSGDDDIKEGGKSSSSNSGRRRNIVAYVVNNLLHKDVTQSNWSRSKQEEEEVELELETCFFDLLMCELLSDLLKPFCNDPVQYI